MSVVEAWLFMGIDAKIAQVQAELDSMRNPTAFILKYHHEQDREIQYLVILALWRQAQQELDLELKLSLLQRFWQQYAAHTDQRVKKLLIFTVAELLKYSGEHLDRHEKNELCNRIILFSKTCDETNNSEVITALCEANLFKAEYFIDKDVFKAEYFFQRLAHLSAQLDYKKAWPYHWAIQMGRMHLLMLQKQSIDKQIKSLFDSLPKVAAQEYYVQFLTIFAELLEYVGYSVEEAQFKAQLDEIKEIINSEKFMHILNAGLASIEVADILQYLTYLFWVGKDMAQADILVQRYFQTMDISLKQILAKNERFYISDAIDLPAFHQYLATHYERFVDLQKYRHLFGVQSKRIKL